MAVVVVALVVVGEAAEEENWMEMEQTQMLCLHSGKLCLA